MIGSDVAAKGARVRYESAAGFSHTKWKFDIQVPNLIQKMISVADLIQRTRVILIEQILF